MNVGLERRVLVTDGELNSSWSSLKVIWVIEAFEAASSMCSSELMSQE